jgi:hypothetical protein
MSKRKTYAVFQGEKWGRTDSLKMARRAVKEKGGEIYALPYSERYETYDAPTFHEVGERVDYGDFRKNSSKIKMSLKIPNRKIKMRFK